MIRRPPRSTQSRSSAASDVYKRQLYNTSQSSHSSVQPATPSLYNTSQSSHSSVLRCNQPRRLSTTRHSPHTHRCFAAISHVVSLQHASVLTLIGASVQPATSSLYHTSQSSQSCFSHVVSLQQVSVLTLIGASLQSATSSLYNTSQSSHSSVLRCNQPRRLSTTRLSPHTHRCFAVISHVVSLQHVSVLTLIGASL